MYTTTKETTQNKKSPALQQGFSFLVGRLGLEPRLFSAKVRRVASYTISQTMKGFRFSRCKYTKGVFICQNGWHKSFHFLLQSRLLLFFIPLEALCLPLLHSPLTHIHCTPYPFQYSHYATTPVCVSPAPLLFPF